MTELLYPAESDDSMRACFQVSKNKGCGFMGVYQQCLEIELVYLVCFVG